MTQNPAACPNCGHHVFEPIDRDDLPRNDGEEPQSIDPADLGRMSSVPASRPSAPSPDVAPDGSLATTGAADDGRRSVWTRLRRWLPF
ncbi:MAG: hypothetical protein ABEJ23_01515 [Haloarculaceae archaeon]